MGFVHEGKRGWRIAVLHFVLREETGEVEWTISKLVGAEPLAEATEMVDVLHGWNQEVGDFEPYTCGFESKESIENGCEGGTTHFTIDVVAQGFEVDIGCIEVWCKFLERCGVDVASRHKYVFQGVGMCQLTGLEGVFEPCEGLCIGVCDSGQMVVEAELYEGFWGEVVMCLFIGTRLGNLPVLTVLATEIATCACYGKATGARQELVEGFLLNGVDGKGTGFTVALGIEFPVNVDSGTTDASLVFSDDTLMGAKKAFHLAILQGVIK